MKTTIPANEQKEIDIANGFYRKGEYMLFSITDTTVLRVYIIDEYCSINIDSRISQYDSPEQWQPIAATEFIEAYGKARDMQGAAFAEAIRSISPEAIKDVNLNGIHATV